MSNLTLKNSLHWGLRLIVAGILLQTLYFKFTAAPESVYIFEKIGMEPWGRISTGIVELIAGILLLIPRWSWIGAILGLGVISGAIFYHFITLGVEVQGDGGTLFYLALVVLGGCLVILFLERDQLVDMVNR